VLFLPEQTTPRQGGEFYLGDFEDFTIGGDNSNEISKNCPSTVGYLVLFSTYVRGLIGFFARTSGLGVPARKCDGGPVRTAAP
jgi:hypothetical protein